MVKKSFFSYVNKLDVNYVRKNNNKILNVFDQIILLNSKMLLLKSIEIMKIKKNKEPIVNSLNSSILQTFCN